MQKKLPSYAFLTVLLLIGGYLFKIDNQTILFAANGFLFFANFLDDLAFRKRGNNFRSVKFICTISSYPL